MAKLTLLHDVQSKLPLDAQLDQKHCSERDLAVRHLEYTQDNDLLLYDRGYYAYGLVLQHILLNLDFCYHLKSNACTQVETFIQSGKKQAIITLEPTDDMLQKAFLNIEDFSGRNVHSIKQDIHASVLIQALVGIECFANQPFIPAQVQQRQHTYKINFMTVNRSFKRRLVDTLKATLEAFDIYRWLTAIARNLTIVKPGRSFVRTKVRCRRQKLRKGYKA